MAAIESPDDPRHGTYAGVRAHQRARRTVSGHTMCDDCRRVNREHQAAIRAARSTGRTRQVEEDRRWQTGGYVDPVVVHRVVVERKHCDANPAERAEIIRQWLDAGRSLADLERVVEWSATRALYRLRTAT